MKKIIYVYMYNFLFFRTTFEYFQHFEDAHAHRTSLHENLSLQIVYSTQCKIFVFDGFSVVLNFHLINKIFCIFSKRENENADHPRRRIEIHTYGN